MSKPLFYHFFIEISLSKPFKAKGKCKISRRLAAAKDQTKKQKTTKKTTTTKKKTKSEVNSGTVIHKSVYSV